MLIHGRTSNRLKTMKYLALVDSLDLDTMYNIFIPDMRNSGKSQATKTYMGYKFGEDVAASILLMHNEYKQDTFFLYGFSMGAMAILNATARVDLTSLYNEKIFIERIIFDSPLVNVKGTLRDQVDQVIIAKPFFYEIFKLYSENINGNGEDMTISKLMDPEIPTLILQSNDDETTRPDILEMELNEMNNVYTLQVEYFEGPGHVKIFQDKRTQHYYINTVKDFLSHTSMILAKNR